MADSRTPRAKAPLLVVAALLIGTGVAPVVGVGTTAQVSQPETDNTVTRIAVGTDGSADWTVQVRTRLDTPERVEEYESFQEQVRSNSTVYLDPFRARIRGVVSRAANATGREMHAEDFTIETSIQEVPRRWGVVTFRFTWTGFADRSDERLVVGDVFEGGFFLAENDTLEVRSPIGYTISEVAPQPADRSNGSVTWVGREDFADERPRVAFVPAPDQQTGDGTTPQPSSPTSTAFGGDNRWLLLGGVLLALLVAVAGYVGYRRRGGAGLLLDRSSEPSSSANVAAAMTDEERVLELLEERDGRVRQADIAEAFEWSDSKTSRVIGRMVEAGDIEKLQLGRENLIDLVDEGSE